MEMDWQNRLKISVGLNHPTGLPARRESLISAAVMLLFSPGPEGNPYLLLTRRSEQVETHKGQIALPGGMQDPGENLKDTAFRELQEELGIGPEGIELLGELPGISTVSSGFWVVPFVAASKRKVPDWVLRPAAVEIDLAFWLSWFGLLESQAFSWESIKSQGRTFNTPVFRQEGHRIWGATALMILNLKERWERAGVG